MMQYPTDFSETTVIPVGKLGPIGNAAAQRLSDQQYQVQYGLTPDYADAINNMAHEKLIREFCPNDLTKRFTDHATTQHWLSKGRTVFLLLRVAENGTQSLAGYGWTGAGASEYMPHGETTYAVRIGEHHQGKGLAVPFIQIMLATTAALFGAQNFWLETWASNGGAVHNYHKIGFTDAAEHNDTRPTSNGETVADTRLFMQLSNDLLPPTVAT